MKTLFTILFSVTVFFFSFSQNKVVYKGKIGNYNITLTLDSCNHITGKVYGRYHYNNKPASLIITGEFNTPVLTLTEKYQEKITGEWFLEAVKDSLVGSWINNTKKLKVKLLYSSGDKNLLKRKTEVDYNKEVNNKISGLYQINYNFINDMWVDESNLSPEIGYNGGNAEITELDANRISFQLEMICGPTYHMAFAEGIATKVDGKYMYTNEDGCEISLEFKDKKLIAKANNSMSCGFGARAYLDHELYKIKDR